MSATIINIIFYGTSTVCGMCMLQFIYKLVKITNYIDYHQQNYASNHQPRFRSEFHKIEHNDNDWDDGYDCACDEFLNQCNTSMKSTMDYTNNNLQILESGEKLDMQYVKGALALLVLPKWTLMVNEVPYIVRATPKSLWTTAWVIEENSSKELDEKLQKVVLNSLPDMTDIKIENLQRLVRKNMYQVLDDLVSMHAH